jgi:hypothetical protein
MTSSADMGAKPVIDPTRWHSVRTGDPQTLAKARAETINIVQWLARIANSYVVGRAREDRVLLEFRAADAAFVTKTFDNGLSLEMRLPTLEMQFLENGRAAPHILDPEEHSPAEVEAWLLVELLHRGVDRTKFTKKLPYGISDLMTGDAEDYSPQSCQEALTRLMAWFQNAATILDATVRASSAGKVGIICWPQTLELSCVMDAGSKPAGFGFSPGDGQNPEPFFYRGVRAPNGSGASSKCSILTASKLLAENDPAKAAITFIRATAV